MKQFLLTLLIELTTFLTKAQTSDQIHALAPQQVQQKMDENKQKGETPLKGISAQHVLKIKGLANNQIADLDVHIAETPTMIKYAMNLNNRWTKVLSIELECSAATTLDEIKAYFQKINIVITDDKVTYALVP